MKLFENKFALKDDAKLIVWRKRMAQSGSPKGWGICTRSFQLMGEDAHD